MILNENHFQPLSTVFKSPTHSGSYVGCPYNPCLTFDFELALDTHTALFHHECIVCRPLIPESETLCPSCQHLNLRHLLLCVPKEEWFHIVLGTIAEISKRPECPQCRVIARIIQRNREQAEKQWGAVISDDNECILGQAYTSEVFHGNLYYQIFFFGRKALKKNRGSNIPRYYLEVRFQDLQLQIPSGWDPDETPDPLYNSAVSEFGFSELARFQPVSATGSQVDWIRVLDLVRSCQKEHNHQTSHDLPQVHAGPHYVVDVRKRCIVRTPAVCRYITLSYVWGSPAAERIRTTKANIEVLKREGSLSDEALALTISDAMQVCAQLGERYLWVDALCIVQDDAEQKEQEIRLMGDIYRFAYLTIVAAAGKDAEAGLAGVSCAPRSMSQLAVAFRGLEAVEVLPCFEVMANQSIWNTRAWTYQERILSKRALYFTDCQVFHSCDSGIRYEDSCGDRYLDEHDSAPFRTHSWKTWHPWLQYLSRRFRRSWAHTISEPCQPIFGLPECNFDQALLWRSTGPYQRRIVSPDTLLPSWSWGSHRGPVMFSLCNYNNFAGSLIRFYIWSHQALSLVSLNPAPYWHVLWPLPGSSESTASYPHDRALYLAIAWKQGCATSSIENNLTDEQLVALFKDRIEQQCQIPGDPKPVSQSFERLDPEGIEAFPSWAREAASSPGSLLFRAPFAKFSLFDHSAVNERDGVYKVVTDSVTVLTMITTQGLHAGFIEMDRVWAEHNLRSSQSRRMFNFIALSIGRISEEGIGGAERQVVLSTPSPNNTRFPPKESSRLHKLGDIAFVGDPKKDTRYFDRMLNRMTTPIVNVMLIDQQVDQHTDVAVSRRLGVGWVFLGRWREAEPQLRAIVLR